MPQAVQYQYDPKHLTVSEPTFYDPARLGRHEMLINIGPQHPSTHGVLRLEVLTDGEVVIDVVPHLGYLHRCFEKHAEALTYQQIIPYVDRMDYLAAMNSEHAYVMGVEKILGIKPVERTEYIRVLVAELNRIASHFVAIGTYAIDMGAFTPFLWMMRDREHIQRLLEWTCGARMLYNYIWIGGLYYDLPVGFLDRCSEFIAYLIPKLEELDNILIDNPIFRKRTQGVGVLDMTTAINSGVTGPMLRASGLRYDLRRVDGYSVYPELEFDIPIGQNGDCWDRTYVRAQECRESARIIVQCIEKLRSLPAKDYDPHKQVPKRVLPPESLEFYCRAENPKGELGFYFKTQARKEKPLRVKARAPSFVNLSVLPTLAKGVLISDLVAIVGSLDLVMGEVDR